MTTNLPDPRPDAMPDADDLAGFDLYEGMRSDMAERMRVEAELDRLHEEDIEREEKDRSRSEDFGAEL